MREQWKQITNSPSTAYVMDDSRHIPTHNMSWYDTTPRAMIYITTQDYSPNIDTFLTKTKIHPRYIFNNPLCSEPHFLFRKDQTSSWCCTGPYPSYGEYNNSNTRRVVGDVRRISCLYSWYDCDWLYTTKFLPEKLFLWDFTIAIPVCLIDHLLKLLICAIKTFL